MLKHNSIDMKTALLIIDPQNDFCDPAGSLYVDGANEDSRRLASWINTNQNEIDYIGITIDSHQVIDIAHPKYWFDENGNNPNPFTVITSADVESGKWKAIKPEVGANYIKALEADGQFPHVIWPEHCVIGTWGNNIYPIVNDAVLVWASNGHHVHYVPKGTHPDTEHFGAFEAQVPIEDKPLTCFNNNLMNTIDKYDVIYIAGQAKSHCVANTLKQIVDIAPDVAKKVVILEDTMSPVAGGPDPDNEALTFDSIAQPIYDEAAAMGVRFSTTEAENLEDAQLPV